MKPYFWVVKLLTTCMGEAVSDFLVNDVNKYGAVVLGFILFAVAMTWQFRTPRYGTWPYWTAVSMVAVFGTMAADVMHIVLGLPYVVSATFYAICLVVTFVAWYRSEGTLDIHSITTRRREVFYWLAVIFTFAMGTALGDLFATTFSLGYFTAAVVFLVAICVPFAAWRLGVNPVLTFWVAYILTRPAGASFADYFGMPKDISGAGFGHGAVSVVTLILVVASIVWMSRTGIDQPEADSVGSTGASAPASYGQQPQYGLQPQYGQAAPYGNQQYGQPPAGWQAPHGNQQQYGDPRYAQPQQGQQYDGQQYGQPQYADPWQDQQQYGQQPRYNQQPPEQYGDQRDYR